MKTLITIASVSAVMVIAVVFAQEPARPAGGGFEESFKRLDRNSDGKLSREEVEAIPALKAGFDYIDTNHDGQISLDEFKAAIAWWQQRRAQSEESPVKKTPPKQATPRVTKKLPSANPTSVDANSPQFRGPRGDGVAFGVDLPVTWSTTNNVVWSCGIPGKGWSSPVIWGARVFVTSAVGPGMVDAPPELHTIQEHVRGMTSTDEHQYMVHCVDWDTGKLLWSRCAHKGVPPGSIHPKNSYASETPVTDGERVYAHFGNTGLFCYDMKGGELWSRTWGSFKMDWNWVPAASPVLCGDLLLVLNDNQEKSFLVALDKRTGKDVWRVERNEKSNWSTPFIWRNEMRTEVVTSGSGKVRSYDVTGKQLWELRGMSGVTVPTPFAADGLLYIASGCQHSSLRPVYAIRAGATGDISLTANAASNAHVAWSQRRAAPYVTSPLVYNGLLYVLLDRGFLAVYDALTGEEVYGKQRFPGDRAAFTASPWAYDGKIFCLSEEGDTYVVEAGPEFRVLHVNHLGETTLATPAVARDSLVIRTMTKLYRIANTKNSEAKQSYDGTARPQAGDSHKPATTRPAGPTPKSDSQAFLDLKFTKDYFPGTKDRNGKLLGGVECNYIVAHKGRLYATVSTWKQKGWNRGQTTGPQVLVKKAHDAPWEVDTTFGPEFGRAECLRSVTFTTDRAGHKLAKPVTLLLATTTGLLEKGLGVWSRNDDAGKWTRMTFGRANSAWGTEIRALIDHVDRVTGVHGVFAAATEGMIYRGVSDPGTPGAVAWDAEPEYRRPATMPVQRAPASCEAGGVLYVSLEMDPNSPGSGGVFRRVDGPKPRWEHVYEWTHAAAAREAQMGHKQDRLVYGLAATAAPGNPERETLICVRDLWAQVLGIDLTRIDTARPEFDAQPYFEKEFQSERAKVVRLAANGFTPLTHPDTGEKVHLAGLWVAHPDGADTEKGNSSWYLVRHADGTYAHGRVWTPDDPVPNKGVRGGLRTTRAICLSPFPEAHGRVLYFGGFDSGLSTSPEEFGYTAWIYKGTLAEKP